MSAEQVTTRAVRLLGVDELADGEGRRCDVDGERIAVFRIGHEFRAIGDRCSHANVSLSEGEVDPDECAVECWKHGALFSLETGEALTLPATQPVPVYDLEVTETEVFVRLPDPDHQPEDES